MRIFVTGATGYIGGAVAVALRRAGHDVRGLVRSAEKAAHLRRYEIEPVVGDMTQPGSFHEALDECSVLVHAAADHAGGVVEPDRAVIDTFLAAGARGARPKTVLYTSGVWIYGDTGGTARRRDRRRRRRPGHGRRGGRSTSAWSSRTRGCGASSSGPAVSTASPAASPGRGSRAPSAGRPWSGDGTQPLGHGPRARPGRRLRAPGRERVRRRDLQRDRPLPGDRARDGRGRSAGGGPPRARSAWCRSRRRRRRWATWPRAWPSTSTSTRARRSRGSAGGRATAGSPTGPTRSTRPGR